MNCNLQVILIDSLTYTNTYVDLLTIRKDKYLISTIYKWPETNLNNLILTIETILDYCTYYKLKPLIIGDFNINLIANSRLQQDFHEFVIMNNLIILANSNYPTHYGNGPPSLLDFALTSMDGSKFEIIDNLISDHLPLVVFLPSGRTPVEDDEIRFRNINDCVALSKLYNALLSSFSWDFLYKIRDLDQAMDYFYTILQIFINKYFPIKTSSSKKYSNRKNLSHIY